MRKIAKGTEEAVLGLLYSTDAGKERGEDIMGNKKLPIGIDGFEKIRTNDFYYVDKTLFIKELLQNWCILRVNRSVFTDKLITCHGDLDQ